MKSDRLRVAAYLCALAAAGVAATASAATYEVAPGSEVQFVAKITATSFVAKSTALRGTVDYDGAVIKAASIEVDATSFTTGMGMRDEHMRDNYLEAAKHPLILFKVESAKVAGDAGKVSGLAGKFVIKGVEKPVKIKIKIAEKSATGFTVLAKFKLDITDYGIPQPKFAVVKMEKVIQVTLKLVLKAK